MKRIVLIISGIILVFVIGASCFLFWLGCFSPVKISERLVGPLVLVCEEHTGPYQETKAVMDRIYYSLLNDAKVMTFKGCGIYYDNPQTVPQSQLRSTVGCILEPQDYSKIPALQRKYQVKRLPEFRAVGAEFPFKNQFSVMAGIFKVYPALGAYIQAKKYPAREMIEIYDQPAQRITYLMPLP